MGKLEEGSCQPIPMRRELRLEASPQELWPLISNTDRFNRALGLPAMTVEGTDEDFSRKVSAKLLGLKLSWREPPFEWVENRFYSAVREFDAGPIRRFEGSMTLAPEGRGCRLDIRSDFTPRNLLGDLLIRYATGRKAIADAETLIRRIEGALRQSRGEAFPVRRTRSAAREDVLAKKGEALLKAPVDAAAARRLLALLKEGYDDELGRLRPFELADRWGLDRLAALKVSLHAVKAGLLDMRWDILCPNCSAAKESQASLKNLTGHSHCEGCGIEYGINLDDSVELRFSVNPTVRPVENRVFCVGNPSASPFAVAQLKVQPGKPRAVEVELAEESYALRHLKAKTVVWLRPAADKKGASELNLDLSRAENGGERRFSPGTVRLVLEPSSGEAMLVRLEKESWKEKGARASLATSLQEFRDLFSSEVLSPGVEIAIKTLALLFSDLKGSTALYEKIGDATAYAMVRDHFDYMFEIIRRRQGAVVKTIGDAVMAVFSTGAQAMEAALEIQERVSELNAAIAPRPPIIIKLGVHQGPAIAINSNEVLDYFGTTVNVAARVQNESAGGDIVITRAMREDPSVAEVLSSHRLKSEPFEIHLKGLSADFQLWRLFPAAGPATPAHETPPAAAAKAVE